MITRTEWDRRGGSALTVPDLDRPQAVAEIYDRYARYSTERRALRDAPDSDAVNRRRSALGLLVEDSRAELVAALDDHLDTWRAALEDRTDRTRTDFDQTVTDLVDTRAEVWATASVLAWLNRSTTDYVNYSAPRVPALDLARWDDIVAGLRTETGNTTIADTVRHSAQIHAQSLRHTTATFPDLDRPDAVEGPYAAHRAAIARHDRLGQERRDLAATRKEAEASDRRAFADHIAAGNEGDPGTPAATALDTRLGQLDLDRAQAQVEVQDTYKTVKAALAEHRDTWRTTVTARYDTAARAYRTAIDRVTDARQAMHTVTATVAWLDAYRTGERPAKVLARQPAVAGHQWAEVQRSLVRDADSFGGDAA